MSKYLISFDEGTMVIPEGEFQAVSDATHEVVRAARRAGVWVFGSGVTDEPVSVVDVDADGTVSVGTRPADMARVGGFSIIDVPTRDEALDWAARLAVACRCPQDVRGLGDDPES